MEVSRGCHVVEKTLNKNLSERNCKRKGGVGSLASARTKLFGKELRTPKARRRALRWMILSFLKREFCIIGITIAPYSIELRIVALKIVISEKESAPHHVERRHLIILISFKEVPMDKGRIRVWCFRVKLTNLDLEGSTVRPLKRR